MPWILSGLTLFSVWLIGRKNPHGWLVSGFNNMLWVSWSVFTGNYGFLPMGFTLMILAMHNWRKWRRDESNRTSG